MNEQISGKIIPLTLENYQCSFYLPKNYESCNYRYPVIYLLGESNIAPVISAITSVTSIERSGIPTVQPVIPTEEKESVLSTTGFLLLGIETQNWENDFTPWKAETLNKKSPAFTGGASTFLELLITKIKPYIDKNYRTLADANNTSLIGYSLAGLTTLYALYITHFANNFASCSGSLWYKDWISYTKNINQLTTDHMSTLNYQTNVSKSISSNNISNKQIDSSTFSQQRPLTNDHLFSKKKELSDYKSTNIPLPTNRKLNIYLSLGNAEKNSRHPLMSQVETCTLKTIEILKQQFPSAEIFFEYNNGGHFTEVPTRIAKAIIFLQNAILNKNKDSL